MNFQFTIFNFKLARRFLWVFVPAVFVLSAITPAQAAPLTDRVTMDNLGGEPAILITNPFYAGKDFFSDVKNFFITNRLAKVNLHLATLNEKAAEILKLIEVAPDNTSALSQAFMQYQHSVIFTLIGIGTITNADVTDNDISKLADALALHLRFVDDMRSTEKSSQNQALLVDIEDRILDSLTRLLNRVGATGRWVSQNVQNYSLTTQGFSDLRTAELFVKLSKKAQMLGDNQSAKIFSNGAQTLLQAVSVRVWAAITDGDTMIINDLAQVSGTGTGRLASLQTIMSFQFSLSTNADLRALAEKLSSR